MATEYQCRYFVGEKNVTPRSAAEARLLIGKRVKWLCHADIDKSGRGFIFPQYGTIAGVYGKNIAINDPANFCIHRGSLVEMALA